MATREAVAVTAFVGDLRHTERVRRRLFSRTADEPERVLAWLDRLPEGLPHGLAPDHDLLRELRQAATAALRARC